MERVIDHIEFVNLKKCFAFKAYLLDVFVLTIKIFHVRIVASH